MIAFFDTSVHIDILRGHLDVAEVLERVQGGPRALASATRQVYLVARS
jgi:hypothetical protein